MSNKLSTHVQHVLLLARNCVPSTVRITDGLKRFDGRINFHLLQVNMRCRESQKCIFIITSFASLWCNAPGGEHLRGVYSTWAEMVSFTVDRTLPKIHSLNSISNHGSCSITQRLICICTATRIVYIKWCIIISSSHHLLVLICPLFHLFVLISHFHIFLKYLDSFVEIFMLLCCHHFLIYLFHCSYHYSFFVMFEHILWILTQLIA